MTEIKNIRLLLDYYFNNFKDEYAIATALLIYVDTSEEAAIKKEIIKRIDLFKNENENINDKCNRVFNILKDLQVNVGLVFGTNEEIFYDEEKFTPNYKFISDFCKGTSIINSSYSKEYKDMAGDGYKRILSQLLIKINNNLIIGITETKTKNLDTIRDSEINYISNMKSNKTNKGIKLLNFHRMIENDRELYFNQIKMKEDALKKEQEIKEKEFKMATEKNQIIGETIGIFILYNHIIYEIKSEEYNLLANKIKEKFKTDYNNNITKDIKKIEDIAIYICEKNNSKFPAGKKDWGKESDGINIEKYTIIRAVSKFKIKLNKNLLKDDLIKEMREINSYLIDGLNSVQVKKIVEDLFDNKQKQDEVKVEKTKETEVQNQSKKDNIITKTLNWFKS
jgi:hypothetical protein